MKICLKSAAAITAAAALATSCSQNKGWTVEGNVDGATADDTLYVEESVYNNWQPVDTIALTDGKFEYKAEEAAANPSVYRLRLGQRCIYFPVDSAETVTVSAKSTAFDRGYKITGNAAAAAFVRADSLIAAAVDSKGAAAALADPDLKRELSLMVNHDTTCLTSYYIVGKYIGDKPVYNLGDKADLRVLANAANNYDRLRPSDPRAAELKARWTEARRAMGHTGTQVRMEAELSARPKVEIRYHDAQGKLHDFNQLADRGGVTVLNFTRYDGDNSQANTVALNSVYEQFKGQGLEIYQIAYDPDEHSWRRSAKNMPWIAVYAPATDDNRVLVAYNVDPIHGNPVSFVFNRQGELVERVADPSKLGAAIARAL